MTQLLSLCFKQNCLGRDWKLLWILYLKRIVSNYLTPGKAFGERRKQVKSVQYLWLGNYEFHEDFLNMSVLKSIVHDEHSPIFNSNHCLIRNNNFCMAEI